MTCKINENCFGQVTGHHVKSKGSGGSDTEDNLWPLCVKHHAEIHNLGVFTFCDKYGIKLK
jgi:hypothetical protein